MVLVFHGITPLLVLAHLDQEFSRHALSIHHDSRYKQASRLLVARDDSWQSNRQMLIASV